MGCKRRVRTNNSEPGYAKPLWYTKHLVTGEVTENNASETLISRETDRMVDYVCDNFKERVNRGDIIVNNCDHRTSKFTAGGGSYNDYNPDQNALNWASGPGSISMWLAGLTDLAALLPLDDRVTKAVAKAKLQAIAGIDSTPYAFGESLFEIKETLQSLRSPFTSFRNLARRFYDGRVWRSRKGWPLQKAIEDSWLEVRYAWRPTLYEVRDILDAVTTDHLRPQRAVTRRKESFPLSETTQEAWGAHSSIIKTIRSETDVEVVAGILYELKLTSSEGVDEVLWKLGLRWKDLPYILWQVMPLSFAVDRLVDVSSAIGGLSNLLDPNVTIEGAWYSIKRTSKTSLVVEGTQMGTAGEPNRVITVLGDTAETSEVDYLRNRWIPNVGDLVPGVTPDYFFSDISFLTDMAYIARRWIAKGLSPKVR